MLNACKSSRCKHCGRRHHSLLHRFNQKKTNAKEVSENNNIAFKRSQSHDFLPTAVIQVVGNGVTMSYRDLFDTGAQANLITASCTRKTNLKQEHLNVNVNGIGRNVNLSKPSCVHFIVENSKVLI